MSFENIQLPPFLIQDLYKNFLIDDKTDVVLSDPLKNAELSTIGSNKKNILILLNEQRKSVIDKKDLVFLEGILKACNLTVEDIIVFNLKGIHESDYIFLAAEYQPVKVLLFGVEPADIKLPLHFPHNQIQQHNGQLYVSSPSLKTIASEKSLKQSLWGSLQKIFNLK